MRKLFSIKKLKNKPITLSQKLVYNMSEKIIGQISQIHGNSIFSVLPVGDNNQIKAKPIGTMCDMRKSSKNKNKLKIKDWVYMTKIDYKINGGIKHLIFQKLTDKEGEKYVIKTNDSILSKHSDILDLDIQNVNILNINNNEEEIDIDNL